jgi:hypothetical protein
MPQPHIAYATMDALYEVAPTGMEVVNAFHDVPIGLS